MDTNEAKIYFSLLIAACIFVVILLLFIISLFAQFTKNKQLYKEKINAEITASEKERKIIAEDMHDDIGPLLSAAKLLLSSMDITDENDMKALHNANKYIDEVIANIRRLSNALLPTILTRKGLVSAIKEYCDHIADSGKMKVTTHFFLDKFDFKGMDIHYYRIIQETINNSLKHSKADVINLTMEETPEKLVINIRDNGIGFDYKKNLDKNAGLGLRNILSRVELLRGELFIETAKGKGVHYTIEIPV
ncbi:MAG: hypothetical protein JWN76_568 [Chitinophagaceae bacterium]|nr:hypothetical protein [Chitinophagaceae bacterium]